jgi:hypothetical protein
VDRLAEGGSGLKLASELPLEQEDVGRKRRGQKKCEQAGASAKLLFGPAADPCHPVRLHGAKSSCEELSHAGNLLGSNQAVVNDHPGLITLLGAKDRQSERDRIRERAKVVGPEADCNGGRLTG